MAERIAIANPFAQVEVDLWGTVYRTKDIRRSESLQIAELEEKLADLPSGVEGEDKAVEYIGGILDCKLEGPIDDDGNLVKPQTKPSTLIKRKWKNDELSVRQLFNFLYQIGVAEEEATGRPI